MFNYLNRGGLAIAAALLMASASWASAQESPDTLLIPTRAVVVTGNHRAPGTPEMIGVYYSTEDTYFSDPGAPRFLFLDREGKIAMGVGGQIYGTLQYDMNGSIDDGSNFTTYDIHVPNNPAYRQAFHGDASHSSLFLKMVGKTSRFGYFTAYLQTNFTGGGTDAYGLKLKQAYLSLGNVTVGLTNTLFADPAAGPPTIDTEGPAGQVSVKNVILKYNPRFRNGFSLGVSVEMPKVDETGIAGRCEQISQRVPDIPAYVQYAWNGGASHIRLSALLRTMSYRDLMRGENRFQTGWGLQLSGMAKVPYTGFKAYYQAAYGAGYAHYLNDLSCGAYDLVYAGGHNGRMEAPHMLGLVGGLQYNFSSKCFMSASYSYSRLYDCGHLGGDTYKYANYVVTNLFYDILPDLRTGVEYLWGQRRNYDGERGHANRLMALVQFSF